VITNNNNNNNNNNKVGLPLIRPSGHLSQIDNFCKELYIFSLFTPRTVTHTRYKLGQQYTKNCIRNMKNGLAADSEAQMDTVTSAAHKAYFIHLQRTSNTSTAHSTSGLSCGQQQAIGCLQQDAASLFTRFPTFRRK